MRVKRGTSVLLPKNRPPFTYGNDYVYANDKPGLGVDIDEAEASKYPCENTVTT